MILAVLQARMSSKRLPGKAMATLQGQPMILRQLERLRRARTLSKIIVATSAEPVDDGLAGFLVSRGQTVFRGSGLDLLDRIARCAEAAGPVSHVVRIKGDAPFVDPSLVDEAVRLALTSRAAYVSNRVERTYPL
ncbi:MAG: acylneuraminate cytidylyltransferase, partial [Caulobacter sp.]|nr:acylneuraminate cytidylyltransferase [Caulobacter sp.]